MGREFMPEAGDVAFAEGQHFEPLPPTMVPRDREMAEPRLMQCRTEGCAQYLTIWRVHPRAHGIGLHVWPSVLCDGCQCEPHFVFVRDVDAAGTPYRVTGGPASGYAPARPQMPAHVHLAGDRF